MQNRILCVKCSVDGELPQKRKARLTIWSPHPLQHTDDSNISIVKGYKNYYLFPLQQIIFSHMHDSELEINEYLSRSILLKDSKGSKKIEDNSQSSGQTH